MFGIFGQNFETTDTVYRENLTCGICLVEDCVGSTCEECEQEVRADLGSAEEARVCWPCYAVILLQLGDALHFLASDSVPNIMQYLDTAAETNLRVLQYRRHVRGTTDAGRKYAKDSHSARATLLQRAGRTAHSGPRFRTMNSRQLTAWIKHMNRKELLARIQQHIPQFNGEGMTRLMLVATLKHLYAGNSIRLGTLCNRSQASDDLNSRYGGMI